MAQLRTGPHACSYEGATLSGERKRGWKREIACATRCTDHGLGACGLPPLTTTLEVVRRDEGRALSSERAGGWKGESLGVPLPVAPTTPRCHVDLTGTLIPQEVRALSRNSEEIGSKRVTRGH